MGNYMKQKNASLGVASQRQSTEILNKSDLVEPIQDNQKAEQSININDQGNNTQPPGMRVKPQRGNLAEFKQQLRQQKLQQNKDQEFQPLFEYLMELAQQSEPKKIDMDQINEIMKSQSHINKCVLKKEFSGLTLFDYCFQNKNIHLIKFLIERINLSSLQNPKLSQELGNTIFKAFISSSKAFNKQPDFFFEFLDLFENSSDLCDLFQSHLENANIQCFFQCKIKYSQIILINN